MTIKRVSLETPQIATLPEPSVPVTRIYNCGICNKWLEFPWMKTLRPAICNQCDHLIKVDRERANSVESPQ